MFALSMIYSFLLSADGLRTRNVTQLVALVLFQVAILVYAALMGWVAPAQRSHVAHC